uniref:Uncharacterized protein n=1 Tax=Globisporangium ultimum (strain ATCC 200006 / CBS 805.95 / DAOM BR144) TaxID=431595 RepID=K3X8T9_GLOUD
METTSVLPLPAPSITPSRSNPDTDRQLERLRIAEKSARIAAKRITEFRETQAQKKVQFAIDAAAQKKARQKFRASNQKVYQQMGIYHLTGEQRYQLLVEEKKLKKAHDQAKLKLETQQRWYNVKRAANLDKTAETLAHMEKLEQLEQQNHERWHRETVQRSLHIKQRQAALRKEAKTIINACTRSDGDNYEGLSIRKFR